MELPDEVLRIIKEYSMPLTRPDWRILHIMPYELYFADFENECCERDSMDYGCVFNTFRYIRMFHEN